MELKRFEPKPAKQIEVAMRFEPKTSAMFLIVRCALSTELSRSRDNLGLAQNGAKKPTTLFSVRQNSRKSYFAGPTKHCKDKEIQGTFKPSKYMKTLQGTFKPSTK